MKIGLVSLSKDSSLTPAILLAIAGALETQLYAHYAPEWQSEGVPVTLYASLDEVPSDTSPLLVFDDPDQANALGWHSANPRGQPYGRAFWGPIRKHGGSAIKGAMSLSATLSHEVLEMVGNPYVTFWADLPDGTQEALELCDRVEADSYEIDGVSVSNFLTPRAFRDGDGPYDFMRLLTEPWELRPGGYAIRRKGEEVFDVWGQHYLGWRRDLKEASPRLLARHRSTPGLKETSISTQLAQLLPGLTGSSAALLVAANAAGVLEASLDYAHLQAAIADATPTQTELQLENE